MQVYEIECRKVDSFADFIHEMNTKFVSKLEGTVAWNGNLDALNDLVSWPAEIYEMKFNSAISLGKALSFAETRKWLEHKLTQCHPSNREEVMLEIDAAERNVGTTLYDHIMQIFADHPELVRLTLK